MSLTIPQRAERVLMSQGYAPLRLPSLPEKLQADLASLCDDGGTVAADTRAKAGDLMRNYFAEQKAVVEPEAEPASTTEPPAAPFE